MKLSDITKFITNYPERIIFGICAILLVIVLAVYLAGGKEDDTVAAVMLEKIQLDEVIKMNAPAVLGPIEYLKKIRGIWEEIQQPMEGKGWLMYRPPVVAVKFTKEETFTREKKPNLPPIVKSIKAENEKPDEITLTWDGNISSTAQIKGYKIYRRAQGEKDFTELIEIPAVTPTESGYVYVDKGVKPETEYAYYFTGLSDEPNVIKPESDRSGELKVITPNDYKIEFIDVIVEKNSLYVKISKYLNGKWDSTTVFINKGEKIDKDKFITGWTFVDFQPDVYEVSKGGGIIKKKTFRVFYLDKKGRPDSFLIPPK